MKYTLTLVVAMTLSFISMSASAKKVHHTYHAHKGNHNTFDNGKKVHLADSGKSSKNEPLSKHQRDILSLAYATGKKDGLKKPEILAGIIYQESKAGTAAKFRTAAHKGANDQTVGLGQIKVKTAKGVLKRFPKLKERFGISDKNIAKNLANNDEFNIAVASKYLVMICENKCSSDFLTAAYNKGEGGASKLRAPGKLPYVKLVNKHIANLKLSKI